ncbi:MAG: SDR family NAD(P)-dependent oxidoreductase [Burkholderiaceae bacterium]
MTMLEPEDRVIMISGANRGIGRATMRELAKRGYRLSLGVRDPASLELSGLDDKILCFPWNATKAADSSAWVEATLNHFGQLDGLVLNAGVLHPVSIEDDLEPELDEMWDVNFKGPLRLIRAAWPALKPSGQGRVINIVSLAGVRVLSAANLGYAASKYAAMALTHAVRQQGWELGIRATAVCPGLVETDMTKGIDAPEGQFKMAPDAIAATVAYALSLPNDASVAEILVNSRLESTL